MRIDSQRRSLVAGLVGGVAGIALTRLSPGTAFAATEPNALTAVRLTDRLVQLRGVGGNVVLSAGADGLAMVDSGSSAQTAEISRFIAEELGGAPVAALLNTHWHLPHTGGNDVFAAAGAKIFAHENTRLWMSTEFYVVWEDRTYPPRAASALPTQTFYSSDPQPLKLDIGTRAVEYAHLRQAHTDGDIYAFFPDDNVLVAGDVLAVGAYPTPDFVTGGWIGGLIEATRRLIDLCDARTRIVPGVGPVQTRADLQAQHDMLVTVRGSIEELMRKGRSAEEMLAERVTKPFDATWGDPDAFVSNVYDGLWWGGRLSGSL